MVLLYCKEKCKDFAMSGDEATLWNNGYYYCPNCFTFTETLTVLCACCGAVTHSNQTRKPTMISVEDREENIKLPQQDSGQEHAETEAAGRANNGGPNNGLSDPSNDVGGIN